MLENGKTYHVKLLSPWNLEYEVLIVGDTTPENVANFGTFDIRGEFFTKFNIGLKTYTSLMRDDTRIYICRIIESRNPIVIKDKATLFIPATIVNETETIELLNSIDITYRIEADNILLLDHDYSLYREFLEKFRQKMKRSYESILNEKSIHLGY